MDPESKKLLEQTFELSKENNQMLKKVRGVQKRTAVFGFFKWVIYIAIAFGSFYVLHPYVDKIANLYNQVEGVQQNFGSFLKK